MHFFRLLGTQSQEQPYKQRSSSHPHPITSPARQAVQQLPWHPTPLVWNREWDWAHPLELSLLALPQAARQSQLKAESSSGNKRDRGHACPRLQQRTMAKGSWTCPWKVLYPPCTLMGPVTFHQHLALIVPTAGVQKVHKTQANVFLVLLLLLAVCGLGTL